MKVLIKNRQRLIKINQRKIKSDSGNVLRMLGLEGAELSILLVNDRRMKEFNSKYRGKDKTTDVLSFPQYSAEARKRRNAGVKGFPAFRLQRFSASALVLGDIVINLQAAERQAQEHNLSFQDEFRWLLIHGILHLIGYDHERSKYSDKMMRRKEQELLKYIQRKE